MNKKEIIAAMQNSHELLVEMLNELNTEEMDVPGVVGNWTIKDILAHLTRWEAELVKLLWQVRQGTQPTTILNQDISLDEVNARWHEEDKDRPLDRILKDFHGVREQTIRRLDHFKDDDLTNPQRYTWLGGRPLWMWVAEDSFEHDLEHMEQIQAWRENRG